MAGSHLFRMGTVKGKNGVLIALKHNKRALQAERGASANINPFRTPLNYSLTKPDNAEAIDRHAKVLMVQAGIDQPRKNQVMAVEAIFSLPIDQHQQDTRPFFQCCMDWIVRNIPGVLLSFDVHLDETAPHAHALILPLVDNKMQGNKIMGGKGNLMRLINLFHAEVARYYGLSRNETKRLTNKAKQSLERQVLAKLEIDPVMKSLIWSCVRDAIHDNPLPFAQLLGIEQKLAKYTGRSFVQIMTSKGKGEEIELNTI
ncbi:MAG TPA: plasmid recombination protein [Nitrosomonas sp.]|nr:plasmid recombination protein [Nitrosomonas sp.]HMW19858.1 plasmid recombination protein [Nitrosomonas sp.]HMW69443.1 plasmid recombination protein [Nitrosomonas sp.]HMY60627.1 plasmid recombination protein [Nitrosomonas sp.]HMY89805.1 plasmid recombination protein [Nitrosomonas sp.]